jgi:hypothetical protein
MISSSLETKFSGGSREVYVHSEGGTCFGVIYGVRRSFCDNWIGTAAEAEEDAVEIREVSTGNGEG